MLLKFVLCIVMIAINYVHILYYRLFNLFTMETILATAFGRRVNVLRGESNELSKRIEVIMSGITDGQIDGMIMLESMFINH